MFTLLFFYHLLGNAVNVGLQHKHIIDTPQYSNYWQEKEKHWGNIWAYGIKALPLHKISCTRTFKNKFLCFSLALSLHKISCTWTFKNKFLCFSLALSLHKISCTWTFKNKFLCFSLALSLHKISCTRTFKNKFLCCSLALSLHTLKKSILWPCNK